jgi:hypothetical protein
MFYATITYDTMVMLCEAEKHVGVIQTMAALSTLEIVDVSDA